MKSPLSFFLSFFLLIFLPIACKKTETVADGPATGLTIAEAKAWYAANADRIHRAAQNNSDGSLLLPKGMVPVWNKVVRGEDDKNYIVECPLLFEGAIGGNDIAGNSLNNGIRTNGVNGEKAKDKLDAYVKLLLLQDKKSGRIRGVLMHIVPQVGTASVADFSYIGTLGNFTGHIYFTTELGKYINGFILANGKIIKTGSKRSNKANRFTRVNAEAEFQDCEPQEVALFVRTCYYTNENQLVGCTQWRSYGSVTVQYCHSNGSASNVHVEEEDDALIEEDDIRDSLTNPCLDTVWKMIMSKDFTTDVSSIVKEKFEFSNKFDLNITNGILPPPWDIGFAKTDSAYKDANGKISIKITMDLAKLPNASREAIVAVYYHEILHAYLRASGDNGKLDDHYISASILFGSFAYFSLFLFTKTAIPGHETKRKKIRNCVYRVCGIIILISMILTGIYHFAGNLETKLAGYKPVFVLESIALVAFGTSWIVKSEAVLKDK